ncbi:MAG: hypothetical protein HYR70_02375 [Chloroflexi bacterium]|nr:hypothetical protein [Chloroflexota bacterium]MBI3340964.1 hypothetical protein [Chloroflexota bacterium]
MNQMSETPMALASPKSFFQVWVDALTKPSEFTFSAIANSPSAKASTAYLWIFIGYLTQFFFSFLVQGFALRRMMESYGGGGRFAGGFGGGLLLAIFGAPIIAVIGTLFFAIGTAIVQWIAKMFGGKGSNGQLAYALAAILTPFSIITGLLSLLSAIPLVGFCFSVILAIAGLYILVLQIMAVKGVNQFGWGAAIGSLFIPGLVIGFLIACAVIAGLAVLGPVIRDSLQQIQQGLGTTPGY